MQVLEPRFITYINYILRLVCTQQYQPQYTNLTGYLVTNFLSSNIRDHDNSGHIGIINVFQNLNTLTVLHSFTMGMQLLWLGIKPVAKCHSH